MNKLYKISSEYEIVPYVFYILYYTGQIYHDEILQQYIEAFKTPKGQALLNCYGLCAKEQKEWNFTSMNGNIVLYIQKESLDNAIKLWCSNNTTILKDTEWFKKNRTWSGV